MRSTERTGPLCVQRAFYPEGDVCHAYVLHPPGGVVGGDRIELNVEVEPGASALLTTPASNKIYRSAGPTSSIVQRMKVRGDGQLEWLPQDTIIFGGSRLRAQTEIHLDPAARLCGWEVTSLGRTHSGDSYRSGAFDQRTTIFTEGVPLLIERQVWQPGDEVLRASWGLAGCSVIGLLYAYPLGTDSLEAVRTLMDGHMGGATLLDRLLVVRVLAEDAVALRTELTRAWAEIRGPLMGRPPCPPRIWAT